MNHLDICSGIGGFALAAKWNGYETIGFCEIDPFCRRVLAKNFPGVPQHDDLWTLTGDLVRGWIGDADRRAHVDANKHGESVGSIDGITRSSQLPEPSLDLITGGYPCQPFSLAGKRMGAEDDRHLWPAIAALVADLKPDRCLFENVGGHVTMGLDEVLSDLEAIGYTCRPVVIPAAAVGAPHRRDRVWILADVADSDEQRSNGAGTYGSGREESANSGCVSANSYRPRRQGHGRSIGTPAQLTSAGTTGGSERGDGAEVVGGMDSNAHGLSAELARFGGLDGTATTTGRGEALPAMRGSFGAEDVQRALRGPRSLQAAEVLLGGMLRGIACQRCALRYADILPAGAEVPWDALRVVWGYDQAASTSLRQRSLEQLAREYPDVVHLLSRFPPPPCSTCWADGSWESGLGRTTTHEPDRTHKLKALGNAIVPAVAYEILRTWDSAETEAA